MMSGRWRGVATLALMLGLGWALSGSALAEEAAKANKYPGVEGYWLPEGASTYADKIDGLFNAILYLTGFIFIVTELLLLYFLIKYRKQEGRKSIYSHGSHRLELIWTLTPAVILLIIAIVQKGTWDEIKTNIPEGKDVVQVKLYGEQFQWNFRYAGTDGKWGTIDDIFTAGNLVVPVHKKVVIEQTSKDVLHSFFLPYMRLKQDLVPGMQIKVWFEATKSTADMQSRRSKAWNYEIVCAELCGNGHSEMQGILKVLEQKEYDEWHAKLSKDFADEKFDIAKIWTKWKVDENGNRIIEQAKADGEKKAAH